MELPFSQACENNKNPIFEFLQKNIEIKTNLLEIGSLTGQHAQFMESKIGLNWFTSDIEENIWITQKKYELGLLSNPPEIISLEKDRINSSTEAKFDNIYTANTLHIVSKDLALSFCNNISSLASDKASLYIYGPFKFDGKYTSDSNAEFENWLKARDPQSGIRDFEFIKKNLTLNGWSFKLNQNMPANNQLLVFKRSN